MSYLQPINRQHTINQTIRHRTINVYTSQDRDNKLSQTGHNLPENISTLTITSKITPCMDKRQSLHKISYLSGNEKDPYNNENLIHVIFSDLLFFSEITTRPSCIYKAITDTRLI